MTAPTGGNQNGGAGPQPPGTFKANNPMKVAENATAFLLANYCVDARWTLAFHRQAFHAYMGSHWREVATETLRAELWATFERAVFVGQVGKGANAVNAWLPFDPNPDRISAIIDAVKAKVLIDRSVDIPAWIHANSLLEMDEETRPCDPHEIMACANGLLHTGTGELWRHTPQFYNHNAVTYAYDPKAPKPLAWLAFVASLWPSDQDAIDTLQEIFGYLLTHRTDLQKLFLFYGEKRGGKGTILRVLKALLGAKSVVPTSMSDLNNPDFGLAPLEHASLAVMSDLRFDKRQDGTAVERILKITGEDEVLINKKYKDAYAATLATRIVIASNLLPKLKDESGALASRYILLHFAVSFLGRENPGLFKLLLPEMPGILNWSLVGLKRLNARGTFVQPASGAHALAQMSDVASPHGAFVRELFETGSEVEMSYGDCWSMWRRWCDNNGHVPGSKQQFLNNLTGAYGHIRDCKRGSRGAQVRVLAGLTPNEEGRLMLGQMEWAGQAEREAQQRATGGF